MSHTTMSIKKLPLFPLKKSAVKQKILVIFLNEDVFIFYRKK